MNKKVIDILPPEKTKEKKIVETFPQKKEKFQAVKPKLRLRRLPGKKKIIISGSLILLLLILGIAGCSRFSKATIEIWPETEMVNFETEVTVDREAEEINLNKGIIPGHFFEKEKTTADNFSSSGKYLKESKASGTIRVYNSYSTSPQILIYNTRFVSTDGKIFRTPVRVTIPGGYYDKGKFIPGEIDIEVTADEPGPEYNIDPSTFSIPGFAGTDRYTKFYAKSFQAMTGGYSQEVPQVTEEDLEAAEKSLIKKAKEEAESSFLNELKSEEISSEFYFSEDAVQIQTLENFSSAEVRTEAETFNYQIKTASETLLFKKEDLEEFSENFILSQVAENKEVYREQLKISYQEKKIDLNSGKITLSLSLEAKIYPGVNKDNLKNGLKGKTKSETQLLLNNQQGINRVEINFWPFWVNKVPEDTEKIILNLNIDPS